jgi:hypothetical protein
MIILEPMWFYFLKRVSKMETIEIITAVIAIIAAAHAAFFALRAMRICSRLEAALIRSASSAAD